MPPKKKYTDPKLRDEVKEEVQQSDKGGAPGQWSARKAQFMASEYKKRGGDYNTDKKQQDESQKNLSKWTEEEWQTKEGSGEAKQADGTEKRYLPKKAWEDMAEDEKEKTDKKKLEESKEGKQFVGNTDKAKNARQKANKKESDEYEAKQARENENTDSQADDSTKISEKESEDPQPGQKRGRGRPPGSNKKQKNSKSGSNAKGTNGTVGSKKDSANPPAQQASADRLPQPGVTVSWKALPGWVEGTVVEIVREKKEVEGKSVKAKHDDPRIVMKSSSSGKIAVHKPEAVYFD
ncbi:hypothetical protein ACLMJK_001072 [Lecanora helva]